LHEPQERPTSHGDSSMENQEVVRVSAPAKETRGIEEGAGARGGGVIRSNTDCEAAKPPRVLHSRLDASPAGPAPSSIPRDSLAMRVDACAIPRNLWAE